MDDRRRQVQEAHRNTFRWIFEDESTTRFAEWVLTGNGIFWINGKLGSGKSTLMKFITYHEQLKELLNIWTADTSLFVASFYFWRSGSELQRSLAGLYRTLLYQILCANEHLCRIAFPNWQRKFEHEKPLLTALRAAMDNLVKNGSLAFNYFIIDLEAYESVRLSTGGWFTIRVFSDILPRLVLKVKCCPGFAVEDCSCRQAETVRSLAITAQGLIEEYIPFALKHPVSRRKRATIKIDLTCKHSGRQRAIRPQPTVPVGRPASHTSIYQLTDMRKDRSEMDE